MRDHLLIDRTLSLTVHENEQPLGHLCCVSKLGLPNPQLSILTQFERALLCNTLPPTVAKNDRLLAVHFQCADESFLRDIHLTELPHLLLPRLLLVQQLAFA